jgi:3-hydroxyisobutyrate dehydrogenase
MSSKPTIGFVGLGAMGFGMATHLVKQGYTVRGFDVFPASVERFSKAGGTPATSLRDSAEGQSYYICMVASAPQAKEVLFKEDTGILQGMLKFRDCVYHRAQDKMMICEICVI